MTIAPKIAPRRPAGGSQVRAERTRERVLDALECWLFDGIDTAMNRYNG